VDVDVIVGLGWNLKSDSSQVVRVVRSWWRRAEAAALVGERWMGEGWGEVESGVLWLWSWS